MEYFRYNTVLNKQKYFFNVPKGAKPYNIGDEMHIFRYIRI